MKTNPESSSDQREGSRLFKVVNELDQVSSADLRFGELTLGDLRDLPTEVASAIVRDLRPVQSMNDPLLQPEVILRHTIQRNLTDPDKPLNETHKVGVPFNRLMAGANSSMIFLMQSDGRLNDEDVAEIRQYQADGKAPGDPFDQQANVQQLIADELGRELEESEFLPMEPQQHEVGHEHSDVSEYSSVAIHRRMQAEASLLALPNNLNIPLPPGYETLLKHALLQLDFSSYPRELQARREHEANKRRYYNARVGQKWRFNPEAKDPQRLSRTRIELFKKCKKCFVLRQLFGLKTPDPLSYKLNIALDVLMKKEFDFFRGMGLAHPLMMAHGLYGYPLQSPELDRWRHSFEGLSRRISVPYQDGKQIRSVELEVFGAVDDLWVIYNREKKRWELRVVDYKSTYTEHEVTLDDWWKQAFKRQVEMYLWMAQGEPSLQQLTVQAGGQRIPVEFSNTAHFVYANGRVDQPLFLNSLPFKTEILTHEGDTSWIDRTLQEMVQIMVDVTNTGRLPRAADCCPNCEGKDAHREVLLELALMHEGVNPFKLQESTRKELLKSLKERVGLAVREGVREVQKHFPFPDQG